MYDGHGPLYVGHRNEYYARDWLFDIHPQNETQFRFQQSLFGVPLFGDWYRNFMAQRSQAERNQKTRALYGIEFGDVTYPFLAGVYGDNVNGSMVSGTFEFSKNIGRLYR